jgi:hypothetical protein
MKTVDRVLEILLEAGYRELAKPLMIGTLPFEFAHALVAEERALDLIVIVDLAQDADDRRLVQKIQSLARALDVMGSKRPLTSVLTSAQPSKYVLDSISRVCRVLPVGAPTGKNSEQVLRDWLAVLMPLPKLEPVSALADWEAELEKQIPIGTKRTYVGEIMFAAESGRQSVENSFSEALRDALAESLGEGRGL